MEYRWASCYGLAKAVADIVNEDNNVDFNANAGITSVIGFQPIHKIGLGAGFRYNYIYDNIHNLYFLVQPKIYLDNTSDSGYIYLNAGFALTKSDVRKSQSIYFRHW